MVNRPSPYRITTFRDAVGLSLELSCYNDNANMAFVIDANRAAEGGDGPLMVPVLIVSVDHGVPLGFSLDERASYCQTRLWLSGRNIALCDWIRTDGDLFFSAAYAVHPRTAWPDDPPHERLADLALMSTEADR
jgi:hypothetical protein